MIIGKEVPVIVKDLNDIFDGGEGNSGASTNNYYNHSNDLF